MPAWHQVRSVSLVCVGVYMCAASLSMWTNLTSACISLTQVWNILQTEIVWKRARNLLSLSVCNSCTRGICFFSVCGGSCPSYQRLWEEQPQYALQCCLLCLLCDALCKNEQVLDFAFRSLRTNGTLENVIERCMGFLGEVMPCLAGRVDGIKVQANFAKEREDAGELWADAALRHKGDLKEAQESSKSLQRVFKEDWSSLTSILDDPCWSSMRCTNICRTIWTLSILEPWVDRQIFLWVTNARHVWTCLDLNWRHLKTSFLCPLKTRNQFERGDHSC